MIKMHIDLDQAGPQDAHQLRALSALFLALATREGATVEASSGGKGKAEPFTGAKIPALTIAPADSPAAGMPSPSEAFGAGNGVAGSGSASLATVASTSAASNAAGQTGVDAALPDPAAAFGGAGNVPAAPAPSNGPPPLPAVTPPITPPGSIAAPSGSSLPGTPAPAPAAAPGGAGSTGAVELDAEGLPWDAAIHASTRAKLANGNWKVKRGTGETFLLERKALLRAALSAGTTPTIAPGAAAIIPPAPAGAPLGNVPAPIPTPQASEQITHGTAASNGVVTMAQVLPRVTSAITAGLLTADSAAAIVAELSEGKINNVAMLAVAPHLLAPFAARLDLLGIPA